MTSGREALICGASGLVGGHCLEQLLDHPSYDRVVTIGRRPLGSSHGKLEDRVVDFDRLEEEIVDLAADDVFCCLGTTIGTAGSEEAFERVDRHYAVALARAASSIGATQFLLVSALGADAASKIFYNRVKGLAEREVLAVGPATVHIFRPSLLLGQRREFRLGETLAKLPAMAVGPLLRGTLARYRAIEGKDVAQRMIEVAVSGMSGRHIHYPSCPDADTRIR